MKNLTPVEKEFLKACRTSDALAAKSIVAVTKGINEFIAINKNLNEEQKKEMRQSAISQKVGRTGFEHSCTSGHLELVKYLISFKEYASLEGFRNAIIYNKINIVEYMIFDYKIKIDGAIEEMFIEMRPGKEKEMAVQFFKIRSDKEALDKSIVPSSVSTCLSLTSLPAINKL